MFPITKVADISILHLYGEITLLEVDLVEAMICSLKNHCHHKIVIDLAQVDHVHFSALKKWVAQAAHLREKNGDIRINQPNQVMRWIMQFTGADQHIKDYSSLGDAILSFLNHPGPEDNPMGREDVAKRDTERGNNAHSIQKSWMH